MTDIVKNIENTEQANGLNLPNNFDIEIEKSFQEFLKSNEFKNLEDSSTKQTIQEKFNERLDNELHSLDELKEDNIKQIIKDTDFELQGFETKVCLTNLSENIIKDILNEKNLIEIDENQNPENISKLIKDGKLGEAISKTIGTIFNLFKFKTKGGFDHLDEHIAKFDWKNKSIEEIKKDINLLESKISIGGIHVEKISDLTYLLTEAKKEIIKKENADKENLSNNDFFLEFLKNDIKDGKSVIGKVLLVNGGGRNYGDKPGIMNRAREFLNKGTQSYGERWQHVMIITGLKNNPPNSLDDIQIHHSAQNGVEEISLGKYIEKYDKGVDIISLDIKGRYGENIAKGVVDFAKEKKGSKYDKTGMITDVFKGKRSNKNNSYYCSELIIKGLERELGKNGEKLPEDFIRPSQFLSYLVPDYATTLNET